MESLKRRIGAVWDVSSTTLESSFLSLVWRSYKDGSSSALNRMVSLSSHSICSIPRSNSVTDQGAPPAAFISQSCMWAFSGFGLGKGWLLRKAIVSPEGDQRGCETS